LDGVQRNNRENNPLHSQFTSFLLFELFTIYTNENESGCSLAFENLAMKTMIGSTANQYL